MRTVLDIINIAKVSEYLFMNSIQVKALYGGGTDLGLPYKIYNVRRNVEWAYYYQPQSPTTEQKNSLNKSANYLYSLCVAMALRAEDIVNEGKTITLTWTDLESAQMWISNLTGSGDLNDVNNWNMAFDLPTYGTPFNSVQIVNSNTIVLRNLGTAIMKNSLFSEINYIISVIDTGIFTSLENYALGSCLNLIFVSFKNVQTIGSNCFQVCYALTNVSFDSVTDIGSGAFIECINLSSIYFPNVQNVLDYAFQTTALSSISLPKVISLGDGCFESCPSLQILDFPMVATIGNGCFGDANFYNGLTSINIPSCINLGNTTGDDSVFYNIVGQTITLTVPAALMTCNSGQPDGDIQYLQANNTVTIIEV